MEVIRGFNVPQLLGFDDSLLVIEMTIVTRLSSFFAGAYLGSPPNFTEEIWADWEAEKKTQFGVKWSTIEDVLFELRRLGIRMIDVCRATSLSSVDTPSPYQTFSFPSLVG